MTKRVTPQQIYAALLEKYDVVIADAFMSTVYNLRSQADLKKLIKAIESNSVNDAFSALNMHDSAFDPLAESIRNAFIAAGTMSTDSMPMVIRFSVRNTRAENWLANESSTLISNIVADQQVAVRDALVAGMAAGRNPTDTALDIVGRMNNRTGQRDGGVIGLSAQQEGFVLNAREELASGDPTLMSNYFDRTMRDQRFDGVVQRAIDAEQPVAQDDIDRITQRYSDRLLKLRGDTIGRTESLAALNAAEDESYNQAIEQGVIQQQQITKIWRTAGDNRVRDTHAEMEGQEVAFDQPFESPSGDQLMFPGDTDLGADASEVINCRCDVEYSVDWLAALGE